MKKTLLLLSMIGLCLGARAQTVLTAVPNLIPTNGWGHAIGDAASFIEQVPVTNSIVQVEAFVLRGATSHKLGGGLDVMLPIGRTNSLFGAGFGLAYYNKNFYDATVNARLGGTVTVPLLRLPVYTYIESGGGYNLSRNRAIAQAFAGFELNYEFNAHWTATAGFAVGTVSDLGENVEAIGGSLAYHF